MKVTITSHHLKKVLARAVRLVDKKPTRPILANVKIETAPDNSGLVITATDMTISFQETVPAEVIDAGSFTVSTLMAFEVVKAFADDALVTLTIVPQGEGEILEITSNHALFKLAVLPAQDFPAMTAETFHTTLTLNSMEFLNSLRRCLYAMGSADGRPVLNGLYLHTLPLTEGSEEAPPTFSVNLVATDGHQMAKVRVPSIILDHELEGSVIPRKAVMELTRLITEEVKHLQLHLGKRGCQFIFDASAILTTRLLEGSFPLYQRVIPATTGTVAHVPIESFAQAVDRVALVATDTLGAIKVSFGVSKMILQANSLEYGSARDEVDITLEGEPLEVGFNALYLANTLRHCPPNDAVKTIQMSLVDAGTAVCFRVQPDPDAVFVIMPMKA